MRVLILGGGVAGTSVAYCLSDCFFARTAGVVVIECNAVACAASGELGGFLAQNWCDSTPLIVFARRSFALHAGLAKELGGDWGHRGTMTYGGTRGRSRGWLPSGAGPGWVLPDVAMTGQPGPAGTTALVLPGAFTGAFTGAMMRAAQEARHRAADWPGYRAAAPRWGRGRRAARRRGAGRRCRRDRDGPMVGARGAVAAAGLRPGGGKASSSRPERRSGQRPCSSIRRVRRLEVLAGGFFTSGRYHLCVRDFEPVSPYG